MFINDKIKTNQEKQNLLTLLHVVKPSFQSKEHEEGRPI